MAEVTGTIGNEHVELNNAATEATLRLILEGIRGSSKSAADAISKFAKQSGIDPAAIAAASTGLKGVGETGGKSAGVFKNINTAGTETAIGFNKLKSSADSLVTQLLAGTASASSTFGMLSQLNGPLGTFMNLLGKVAKYQEENMAVYQKISSAGVSLGGSLTDLRQGALNTYQTLEQFGSLMKNNSETFAKLGGTVNDGAKAFIGMSNGLINSEAGDKLLALGYSAAEVNTGLAGYLANTGARTRQDMQNTAAITKGASEYLTQLDGLATITGKSREEQEKALKQANANAAYEQMKMGMTEAQRSAYDKGLAEMSANFGKAGEDLFKSQAMGLPPMTEAAQKLQALSPEVAKASQGMADIGKRGGSAAETYRKSAEAVEGAAQATKRYTSIAGALSFSTDSTSQALMGLTTVGNRARAQGAETAAAGELQRKLIADEQAKRAASQAAEMAKIDKAFKEIGQGLNSLLAPAISYMTKIIVALSTGVAAIVNAFSKLDTGIKLVVGTMAVLAVLYSKQAITEKAKEAAESAKEKLKSVKGMAPGGSPATALWVRIVGKGMGGVGGGPGDTGSGSPGGAGEGKGKAGGKMGKFGKLPAGVGGLAGGLLLDYAGDKLTESGHEKWGAGAGVASSAVTGASMGAMLGVPGAIVGGLLGAAYGAYQNKDALLGTPKLADGGIVTKPTTIQAGEEGPEAIMPLSHLETLRTELQTLNKQTIEMLKYLKETAEHTRRGADATKSLGGDMFKF